MLAHTGQLCAIIDVTKNAKMESKDRRRTRSFRAREYSDTDVSRLPRHKSTERKWCSREEEDIVDFERAPSRLASQPSKTSAALVPLYSSLAEHGGPRRTSQAGLIPVLSPHFESRVSGVPLLARYAQARLGLGQWYSRVHQFLPQASVCYSVGQSKEAHALMHVNPVYVPPSWGIEPASPLIIVQPLSRTPSNTPFKDCVTKILEDINKRWADCRFGKMAPAILKEDIHLQFQCTSGQKSIVGFL